MHEKFPSFFMRVLHETCEFPTTQTKTDDTSRHGKEDKPAAFSHHFADTFSANH
jgi:hypothetical protein